MVVLQSLLEIHLYQLSIKKKASTKSYTFYLDFSDDFVVKNITKKSGGYYNTTFDKNSDGTPYEIETHASMGSFTSDLLISENKFRIINLRKT